MRAAQDQKERSGVGVTDSDIELLKSLMGEGIKSPDIGILSPGFMKELDERVKNTISYYIKNDPNIDPWLKNIILPYIDPYYIPTYDMTQIYGYTNPIGDIQ